MDILKAQRAIKEKAPELAALFKKAGSGSNEELFRKEIAPSIEEFGASLGLNLHTEQERTLLNGRAGTVYNRLVVEYVRPRSLSTNNRTQSNRRALDQVLQYFEALHQKEKHQWGRLAGVVIDGSNFIFARYTKGRWTEDDPLPVTIASTERFLRYLSSLRTEKAVTPENLVKDFGKNTPIAQEAVSTFYTLIVRNNFSRVQPFFNQWAQLFNEVCGYTKNLSKLELGKLGRRFGISNDGRIEAIPFFFALHTYYATFIKILAMQVVAYYTFPKPGTGLAQVASQPPEELKKYLQRNLVEGGIFRDFGLKNFLEGDFFNWYVEVWDDTLAAVLSRILNELAKYSLITLDVNPEETGDLLKKLYQQLVPAQLRHNLGEYYTPDWLAERVLNQLEDGEFRGGLETRILDPACGSGTFLVLVIEKMRENALKNMIPESVVLEKILSNVVGFDLNPLAVITARTNYLLKVGDLIANRKDELLIPVYLADSILTPGVELNPLGATQSQTISFKAGPVGTFSLPKSLVKAGYLDRLTVLLEECVSDGLTSNQFLNRCLSIFPFLEGPEGWELSAMEDLESLYKQFLILGERGIKGIGAGIIKNVFQPLFHQNYFDYVAGNPPWINWESLPEEYRADTKPLWERYGLFPHGGMDTILGKGKKDISMLMAYVAMDRYLKPRGKLGFVLTQSVFKTSGAGQGFRRFLLPGKVPVRVNTVDDLSELQVFEGTTNRTSIVIMEKGLPQTYPVQYAYWRKSGRGSSIRPDLQLKEVQARVRVSCFVAEPVDSDDLTSAWLTGREKAVRAVKKILGPSDYEAHEGVNSGGANGVYWVEIMEQRADGLVVVRNITKGTKREVDEITAAIEPDLLYPLLRQRDVGKWRVKSSAHIILAQDPVRRCGLDEAKMIAQYPETYSYLKRFEGVLRQRAVFKRYYTRKDKSGKVFETGQFYSMFDVGRYTFAPYKVVWPRFGPEISAAVSAALEGKPVIPQETVTLLGTDDIEEAHYFCAGVNSSVFNFAAQSYSQKGGKSFGSMHLLKYLKIPRFNREISLHITLAALSQQAHNLTAVGDMDGLAACEGEIDGLTTGLWGLTDVELKEIKDSLCDLN